MDINNISTVKNEKLSEVLDEYDNFANKINLLCDKYDVKYKTTLNINKDTDNNMWIGTIITTNDE